MRITSKGQVTIPLAIRTRAGLLPHTEVEFTLQGNVVILRKVKEPERGRGARLVEHMRGRGAVRMTTDEIMALTRGG
ncbi:MAG TPA: AbrB/MazE/SpoVT family DNA-binding domain-containing protein [Candidatus Methylomirabilis sp.]|nr:AbrB/MazE/SpoVT family DNA-binding domain-containing protein [Candidatus Methylomirabilis sp.]